MRRISIFDLRRRLQSRPGQGLVEFVLVAPMLLILIFGLIEFARGWNIRHVITDAAREGARVLAVRSDSAGAAQAISTALGTAGLSMANATVVFANVTTPGGDPGSQVTIQYPYNLHIVGTLLGWAIPNRQLTIGTVFTMRNE